MRHTLLLLIILALAPSGVRADPEQAPGLKGLVRWTMLAPSRSIANSGARWWKPRDRCYQRCGRRKGVHHVELAHGHLEVRCFCQDGIVIYDVLMPFDLYEPVGERLP